MSKLEQRYIEAKRALFDKYYGGILNPEQRRAVYTTELSNLNAKIELLDAHRVYVEGPTNWRPAELVAPQALRPAVVILIAMLAAPGQSILRNVYSINRGYQDFAARLRHLGADIVPLTGI